MAKVNSKGFTLVELLLVIAIIAIILAIVFVVLDPLTRFKDSRDSVRWQAVAALVEAIKIDQIDNRGAYVSDIANMIVDQEYMIGIGTSTCNSGDTYCDLNVTIATSCVDLSGLVTEGYLSAVPISPNGDGSWDASTTGYVLVKDSNGVVSAVACESENSDPIYVSR